MRGALGRAPGDVRVEDRADPTVVVASAGVLLTLVAGAANGVLNAALGRQAVASVPADRTAMGSGANNTARYVGSAVGITVCAVIIGASGVGPAGVLAGWNTTVVVTAAISLACAVLVLLVRDRPDSRAGTSSRSMASAA
ncbi:MAG: hypothetical protein QOE59_3346 [Actinomycetota bacterium]|nr:hypothetical protein [Actinomycetota bacterium]